MCARIRPRYEQKRVVVGSPHAVRVSTNVLRKTPYTIRAAHRARYNSVRKL